MIVSIAVCAAMVLAALVMLSGVAFAQSKNELIVVNSGPYLVGADNKIAGISLVQFEPVLSNTAIEKAQSVAYKTITDIQNAKTVSIGAGAIKVDFFPTEKTVSSDQKTVTGVIEKQATGAESTNQVLVENPAKKVPLTAKPVNISSISINPVKHVRAEIATGEGTVLQEISDKAMPVVTYNGIEIMQDEFNQRVILKEGTAIVETQNEVEISDNVFVKSLSEKQKVSVKPSAAVTSIREAGKIEPQKVTLGIEGSKAFYTASSVRKGKLFGIFPVEFSVEAKVDAQTGEVNVEQPFWGNFVFG